VKEYFVTNKAKTILETKLIGGLLAGILITVFFSIYGKAAWVFFVGSIVLSLTYLAELNRLRKSPERIIISSKGVEYYGISFSFKTGWENLESIISHRDIFGKYEGLIVDVGEIDLIERRIRIMPVKILIPLSSFEDNWRVSELGQQIKQYAPHLFEQEHIIRGKNN